MTDTTRCETCQCVTLDRGALADVIDERAGREGFFAADFSSRPHLFADVTVFVAEPPFREMLSIVSAVELAARTPAYIARALSRAPEIASADFGTSGVFMGYDFHIASDVPRLIEINTNAGGAYLAAAGSAAHRACCGGEPPAASGFEAAAISMFEREWRHQRGSGRPERVAIVDSAPEEQYLYPEFVLAKELFERAGIEAVITSPERLAFADGELRLEGQRIDFVYNRLTDFALEEEASVPLREAYESGAVVVSPSPRHHALYADKRNLIDLSDPDRFREWDLPEESRRALATIPRTRLLTAENADALYAERKSLFFKPTGAHGGKGVYRGDKITRSVWTRIIGEDYVAQELVQPSERLMRVDGKSERRKIDVRLYTYEGEVLLAAARVYQGQTTNFRTPGGGFAPVFRMTAASASAT